MSDLSIADDLSIPAFLDLRIPENLGRWKEGRRNWKPGRPTGTEPKPKEYFDRHGRKLPASTDERTLAVLREIEAAEIAAEKAEAQDRKEQRKIAANAKAVVKAAVKAAKSGNS